MTQPHAEQLLGLTHHCERADQAEDALERVRAAVHIADDHDVTERCTSCEHETRYHDADGRCWFTVEWGVPGRDLVCACHIRRAGRAES